MNSSKPERSWSSLFVITNIFPNMPSMQSLETTLIHGRTSSVNRIWNEVQDKLQTSSGIRGFSWMFRCSVFGDESDRMDRGAGWSQVCLTSSNRDTNIQQLLLNVHWTLNHTPGISAGLQHKVGGQDNRRTSSLCRLTVNLTRIHLMQVTNTEFRGPAGPPIHSVTTDVLLLPFDLLWALRLGN